MKDLMSTIRSKRKFEENRDDEKEEQEVQEEEEKINSD
jgi:hypothetical protein